MTRISVWFLAGVLLGVPAGGQEKGSKNIDFFLLEEVIPHVAIGGVWSTTITFVNLSDIGLTFPLDFWTTGGDPWAVFVEGIGNSSTFTVTVPKNGSVTVIFPSVSAQIKTGWAQIEQPNGGTIAGHAIFTDSTPGRPLFEAVVPITTLFDDDFRMPFDNSNGNNTCLALANSSEFSTNTVFIDFSNPSGNRILLTTVDIAPLNQTSFCLANQFPELAGRDGVLAVTAKNMRLSALAFRFNPGGAFTTFFTMSGLF